MPIARYAITSGLSGCYMPDNGPFPIACHTRRELMATIRAEIEAADFPVSTIRQIKARRLWHFITQRGSSCAHFSVTHSGREVAFHGLTEDEYTTMDSED